MPSAERIPPDLVLHHGRGGGGGLVPRLLYNLKHNLGLKESDGSIVKAQFLTC